MMNYKGVIFDFNGTLFFDNDKHILAWNEISRILRNREISEEELHGKFNGTPNEQNIRYMMEGPVSIEVVKEYSELKEELYRNYCKNDSSSFHLVAGAYDYFQSLKDRSIPFTIASASIKSNIDFFRKSFGLDKWMDPDTIVYDDGTYENKIQMFSDAAANIGVALENILIIEDSFSGIKSAYESGCRKIVVVCKKEKEEEYKNLPGVVGTIQTFEEIASLENKVRSTKKKGIIFDMDGTLFDTESVYNRGWEAVAIKYGYQYDREFQRTALGSSGTVLKGIIKEFFPGVDVDQFIADFLVWVKRELEHHVPEKAGLHEILTYVSEKGFKIGIASSSTLAEIRHNLKVTGIEGYFDAIASGEEVPMSKPSPDVFLLAAKRLGLNPSECYVVEDSSNGVRAGVAAGCTAIMVPDVVWPDEELSQKCILVCDSLIEVKDAFEQDRLE